MGLNIDIKKAKGTPYKFVLSDSKILGVFEGEKYIEYKNMKAEHFAAHKINLKELLQEV